LEIDQARKDFMNFATSLPKEENEVLGSCIDVKSKIIKVFDFLYTTDDLKEVKKIWVLIEENRHILK